MVIEPGNGINTHSATTGKARQSSASAKEKPVTNQEPNANGSSASDSVSLSDAGKAMAKLEAELAAMPDVDQARVDEIRTALASGRYQVDAENIADKLLEQDKLL